MEDSSKTRIQQFYASYQAARTDLSFRLEALKSGGQPDPQKLNTLVADVAKLRKEYIEATSFLPSYDQRQYEQFLTATETAIEGLRVSSAPKPNFAFKRRTPKTTNAPTAGASSAEHAKQTLVHTRTPLAPSSHLSLSAHSHQYLDQTSLPTLESSSDLTISDLDHCIVNLLPLASSSPNAQTIRFTALHVRNLTDSVLVLPSIDGSALLHDLKRCTVVLGCHQFRMHTSREVDVHLSIESNPIIEHCSSIRFAGYPSALPDSLNTSPPVLHETSKHLAVQDFSHIRATPSPNWSALAREKSPSADDWQLIVRRDADISLDTILLCLLPMQQ